MSLGIIASSYVDGGPPPPGSYFSDLMAAGPLWYARLGEAANTDPMADASGNGFDGTYSGAVVMGIAGGLTGDSDTAIDLTGGPFAEVAPDAAFDLAHFTAIARIKTLAGGTARSILDRHRLSTGNGFQFRMESNGHIGFYLIAGNGALGAFVSSATAALNDGTWHGVGVICDGVHLSVVDDLGNVDQVANTNAQASTGGGDGIRVGCNRSTSGDGPTAQWLGSIDEGWYGPAMSVAALQAILADQ